jgi:hypothetical protein
LRDRHGQAAIADRGLRPVHRRRSKHRANRAKTPPCYDRAQPVSRIGRSDGGKRPSGS